MRKKIVIKKPRPHKGQVEVINSAKRFNVIANGRRWGKSVLGIYLSMNSLLRGHKVGYFVPSFTFADDIWSELKERLEPVIKYKSENNHYFELRSGGSFKIWSLENKMAGRSRKYHRVIIDEASFVRTLSEQWKQAIRPTLADYKGDAFFLSSPVYGTPFHEFHGFSDKYPNWASFNMPTSTNPFISKEELEEIKQQTDKLTFMQEFEAKFVKFGGLAFAYAFNQEKHTCEAKELDPNRYVYLSFDFNVNPMTCIVCQHTSDMSEIYIHKEFRLENSNIYDMCRAIKIEYGNKYKIKVNGDPAGNARNGQNVDNGNFYTIIAKELNLNLKTDFNIPLSHWLIKESYTLVNSLFYRHPNIKINKECKYLIDDLESVIMLDNWQIDKKDQKKGHLLDTLRYYFEQNFSKFVKFFG